ncbi:hypothetical protein [Methylocystis echinoides]|uniref:hypothetical protein n=1 Tax=Methylocystis echinoides TaxID=29468 RepID=UPI00341AD79A
MIDGKEWILNAARLGDEIVFHCLEDHLSISRRQAGGSFCQISGARALIGIDAAS